MFVCDHELTLNGLCLHGQSSDLQGGRFSFDVSADDEFEFGSHEAVTSVVEALWSDGSRVTRERADNAVTTISVLVEGDTVTDLGAGEAALRRSFPGVDESVDLIWRPGDGAPASVRTVLDVDLDLDSEDLESEGEQLQRVYQLTITHAPFVGSEFETVVEALPTTGVPVIEEIDDFTSASAWTLASPQSTMKSVTVSGGVLSATLTSTDGARGQYGFTLTRTGAVAFTDTPYLVVEHDIAGLPPLLAGALMVEGDGALLPVVSHEWLTDGWSRSVFRAEGTYSTLALTGTVTYRMPPGSTGTTVEVRRFDQSSTPTFGSRQALLRTLDIGGTERTTGALRITGSGDPFPLGTVIVHTSPDLGDGYTPELMDGTLEYVTRTAGENAPSGYWYANAVATTVPSARFAEASYMPVVWLSSANTQTVMVQIIVTSTASPSSPLYYAETIRTNVTFAAGEVKAVPLALVTLPGVRSRVGTVKFAVSAPGAVADSIKIGGLWAYRTGRDCATSIFTTDQPYAFLTPETLTGPQRITVSDVDDIRSGWDPGAAATLALESHVLPAGPVLTHVVTGRVQDAAVSYRYTKKWPFNPADDGSTP